MLARHDGGRNGRPDPGDVGPPPLSDLGHGRCHHKLQRVEGLPRIITSPRTVEAGGTPVGIDDAGKGRLPHMKLEPSSDSQFEIMVFVVHPRVSPENPQQVDADVRGPDREEVTTRRRCDGTPLPDTRHCPRGEEQDGDHGCKACAKQTSHLSPHGCVGNDSVAIYPLYSSREKGQAKKSPTALLCVFLLTIVVQSTRIPV